MSLGRVELIAWLGRSALPDWMFAEKIAISRAYLSQILHGRRRPGLDVGQRIMTLTGIPLRAWVDSACAETDSVVADRRRKLDEVLADTVS